MPNIKISEMTPASSFSGNAVLPLVASGVNQKISASQFFSNIKDSVVFNSEGTSTTFEVKAQGGATALYVDPVAKNVGVGTSAPAYDLHVEGTFAYNGPSFDKSVQTQVVSGAVDLTTSVTIVDSVSAVTLQLAAGASHQVKTIYRKGSGSVVVNVTSVLAGGSSITFNAQGSSVQLHYIDGFWYIRSAYNITVA